MAYPPNSTEVGNIVETRFQKNGRELLIKTNKTTGSADVYVVVPTGEKIVANVDAKNNWTFLNETNLQTLVSVAPIDQVLIATKQKQEQYFLANYTLESNRVRAQVLNTVSPGGTNPTFANTPGYGNNPASGATLNNVAPSGGLLETILATLGGGFAPIGEFDSADDNPAFRKNNRVLKYPEDLIDKYQDILTITQFEYQSPNTDIFTGQDISTILQQGVTRGSALKNPKYLLGQVILPIPNNPQDSNNVQWGEDNMDAFTTAAAATIVQNPALAAGGLAAGGAGKLIAQIGADKGIAGAAELAGISGSAPGAMLRLRLLAQGNTASTQAAVYSFLLNKYGFEISPESILSRGYGVVPNSNLQLLFNNVTLRSFTFSYMMSPRSKREADTINMILRFFKQGMAARKQGNNNLFLGTPNVFKLEYTSNGKAIAGMNKFKICALTSFGVNYAPSGQWAAYDEGQPASVVMTMGFRELEPIFETDYKPTANPNDKSATDRPTVQDNEIGF